MVALILVQDQEVLAIDQEATVPDTEIEIIEMVIDDKLCYHYIKNINIIIVISCLIYLIISLFYVVVLNKKKLIIIIIIIL
jgi:hypothetical protein